MRAEQVMPEPLGATAKNNWIIPSNSVEMIRRKQWMEFVPAHVKSFVSRERRCIQVAERRGSVETRRQQLAREAELIARARRCAKIAAALEQRIQSSSSSPTSQI